MIELLTSLIRFKPSDQAQKMAAVKTGLTEQAVDFPDPPVTLVTYSAKVAEIQANLGATTTKEAELKALRLARPILLAEGRLMYAQNAAYVAGVCGDDGAKAVLTGYELVAEPTASGALAQVENLSVTTGDNAGELEAQHDPVSGATAYESEISENGMTGWQHASTVGVSKETFTGLPSMTIRWIRTRAIRGTEHGPWSDPAKGMVP